MIICKIYLDNIYCFDDFSYDFIYPKKIVNSSIEKEYLEKADAEEILHIGAGNSFFFVGPKEEFKPEDIDIFFKGEAKRRCENYVKYISRSLERGVQ